MTTHMTEQLRSALYIIQHKDCLGLFCTSCFLFTNIPIPRYNTGISACTIIDTHKGLMDQEKEKAIVYEKAREYIQAHASDALEHVL